MFRSTTAVSLLRRGTCSNAYHGGLSRLSPPVSLPLRLPLSISPYFHPSPLFTLSRTPLPTLFPSAPHLRSPLTRKKKFPLGGDDRMAKVMSKAKANLAIEESKRAIQVAKAATENAKAATASAKAATVTATAEVAMAKAAVKTAKANATAATAAATAAKAKAKAKSAVATAKGNVEAPAVCRYDSQGVCRYESRSRARSFLLSPVEKIIERGVTGAFLSLWGVFIASLEAPEVLEVMVMICQPILL